MIKLRIYHTFSMICLANTDIYKDGYLNVSIEQKADKKDEKKEDVKQIEVK